MFSLRKGCINFYNKASQMTAFPLLKFVLFRYASTNYATPKPQLLAALCTRCRMKIYLAILFLLIPGLSIACGDNESVSKPLIFVDKVNHSGDDLYQIYYPLRYEGEEFESLWVRVKLENNNYVDASSAGYPVVEDDKRFNKTEYQVAYIYISAGMVNNTTLSINYESPPAEHGYTLSCGSLAHTYQLNSFIVK